MRTVVTPARKWTTGIGLACMAMACTLAAAKPSAATNGTTTTTLGVDRCSQPISMGSLPTATDCLYILNAAVGLQPCGCVCDPSGDGNKTATDALLCLNVAVGADLPLSCSCGVTTTTIDTTTTTTSTTTTTMGGVDPLAGQMDYDARCAFCHRAGSHDTSGDFSDLAGDGDKLAMDLGALDQFMSGLFMTQPEIDNMAAFLDGL